MLLLDLLVNKNSITQDKQMEIESSLALHPDMIVDQMLLDKGVSEKEVTQTRVVLFGMPLYEKEIVYDPVLATLINKKQTEQLYAIPLELNNEVLSVGVVDPDYKSVMDAIQSLFGSSHRAYKIYLITYTQYTQYRDRKENENSEEEAKKVIEENQNEKQKEVKENTLDIDIVEKNLERSLQIQNVNLQTSLDQKEIEDKENAVGNTTQRSEIDKKEVTTGVEVGAVTIAKGQVSMKRGERTVDDEMIDLTPISSVIDEGLVEQTIPLIFNTILRHAISIGASDVHIENMGEKMRARLRVDGSLETVLVLPATMHQTLAARIKILSGMKLDEKRKPQDGRFSTRLEDHKIDYRVSTFPGYYGEKVVIRILDSYRGVRALDSIPMAKEDLQKIRDALARPYGIILVSGPTGSGKTTTLYSMIGEIDKEHRNVVSLEDPIEYNLPSINQSQVFPEIGYTFASGLRSILRQDPDVIMVGEIRDAETAGLAIQAALTGHLVFSTIHTNTAIGVVTRLLDMGIEPYLIAPTLNLAIGQRLTRSIAEGCAIPMLMDPGLQAMVAEQFKDLPEKWRRGMDTTKAFHVASPSKEFPTGMKGRIPVFEVLTVTEEMQRAILDSKGEEEIIRIAREQGMVFMKEDAMLKCMDGKIPFEEIEGL